MAQPFPGVSLHATAFFSLATLTCAARAAAAALTLSISTNPPPLVHTVRQVAIATAVLDLCALLGTAIACILYLRRVRRRILASCCLLIVLAALPALALNISILDRIRTHTLLYYESRSLRSLVEAGIALCTVENALEILLFIFILWPDDSQNRHYNNQATAQVTPTVQSAKPSVAVHMAILNIPQLKNPAKAIVSTGSPPRRPGRPATLRFSFQQSLHTENSRSKLIRTPSFRSQKSKHSRQSSHDTVHEDDFANWDTTGVEQSLDRLYPSNLALPPRSKGRSRLETIPGSRPTSAHTSKVVDMTNASASSLTLPSLLRPTITTPTPAPSTPPSAPAPSRLPVTLVFYNPTTILRSNPESHIHPLFRSGKPALPTPVASAGTTITASPYAGHILASTAMEPPFRPLKSSSLKRGQSTHEIAVGEGLLSQVELPACLPKPLKVAVRSQSGSGTLGVEVTKGCVRFSDAVVEGGGLLPGEVAAV